MLESHNFVTLYDKQFWFFGALELAKIGNFTIKLDFIFIYMFEIIQETFVILVQTPKLYDQSS